MGKFIDLTGQRFGKLVVIKRDGITNSKHTRWLCKCDCGNFSYVSKVNLKNGSTKSCGCLKKEKFTNYKHGKVNSRLYYIYNGMKARCYNKNHHAYFHYGGRGIKICDEWLDKKSGFISFYSWAINNGYKQRLTIDRIDVNGNYEPNNCRWVTISEQANNKRNNYFISYNGETHTIAEWSKILDIPYSILFDRLRRKRDIDKIFNKPIGHNCIVLQYDLKGHFIKKYNSIKIAKQETGAKDISECCKGKFKQSGGYIWRYADEIES